MHEIAQAMNDHRTRRPVLLFVLLGLTVYFSKLSTQVGCHARCFVLRCIIFHETFKSGIIKRKILIAEDLPIAGFRKYSPGRGRFSRIIILMQINLNRRGPSDRSSQQSAKMVISVRQRIAYKYDLFGLS